MNKGKKISFGKISTNFGQNATVVEPSGSFDTFGPSPSKPMQIENLEDDTEHQQMKEVMGITTFGKKAKTFDIQEMMAQVTKTTKEITKPVENKTNDGGSSDSDSDSDDEDDDLIGPPIPKQIETGNSVQKEKTGSGSDSENESDQAGFMPCSHEVTMTHVKLLRHLVLIQAVLDWLQTYPSRPGTTDSGKEYEVKIAALLMIRTISRTETKHTWVAINVNQCGAFDDVVLCRQTEEGDETVYLIQLKHSDQGGKVDAKKFTTTAKKKDAFSLQKYFNSITEIKKELTEGKENPESENHTTKGVIDYLGSNYNNIVFILFTNKETSSDCSVFLKDVTENSCIDAKWELFETVNTSEYGAVFEFDYEKLGKSKFDQNLGKNFFLITRQLHISLLDAAVANAIEKLIRPAHLSQKHLFDITVKFLNYLDDWSKGKLGGHYPLTKVDFLKKIIELLLEPYMVKLGESRSQEGLQHDIWNEVIDGQEIVYIHESDEVVLQYLKNCTRRYVEDYCDNSEARVWWKANADLISREISMVPSTTKNIQIAEAYHYLWKTRKIPLLLEVSDVDVAEQIEGILKLSEGVFRAIVLNKSQTIVENDLMRFNSIADLDEDLRAKILSHPVVLQGRKSSTQLIDMIYSEHFEHITVKDIIYILCGKYNIGEKFEKLPEIFEQMALTRVWLDESVLLKVPNEMFIILCKDVNNFNIFMQNRTVQVREPLVSFWKDVNINSQAKIIICEHQENLKEIERYCSEKSKIFHFLDFDTIGLEWRRSFGTVENIKSFRKKSELNLKSGTTADLLSNIVNNRRPTLICSEAGMGKSVLLNDIAQNSPSNLWVLKVNLSEYKEIYKMCEAECSSEAFSIFAHTVLERQKCNSVLNKAMFKKYLDSKNIILLLDGFDEIPVYYQNGAKNLIKYLAESGQRMCLTMRPALKVELELLLDTFSLSLNFLSRKCQVRFLTNHFSKLLSSDERIEYFVNQLLDEIKKHFNDKDDEFAGVPFHIILLAQIYKSDCLQYLETGSLNNRHFDSLYLYKHVIEEKIQTARKKIEGISEDTINQYKIYRSFLALPLIFPENNLETLRIEEKLKQATELFPLLMQLIQKDGIIVVEQQKDVTFINRTFAEYLAAEWLYKNIDGEYKDIAKTLVKSSFHPNFDVVRNLFDRILAENCPLHLAILYRQIDEVKRIIQRGTKELIETDKGNRHFLHLIASWGLHEPLNNSTELDIFAFKKRANYDEMVTILNLVPDDYLMKNNKDYILDLTPLDYALTRSSLNVANTVCARVKDVYHFTSIGILNNESSIEYMHKMGYRSLLSTFYRFRYNFIPNLQSNKQTATTDNLNTDSLHFAIENGNMQKINKLISEKSNINEIETSSGYSPLHVAVICGRTEVVRLLISNGADPNGQDKDGRTPLHWALCSGMDNQNQKKVTSSEEVDPIAIPSIILSSGKYIDTKDKDGNTALLLSANSGHDTIVNLLLHQSSEKNKQNNDGDSALSLATYNDHKNVVNLLLSQGCDGEAKNKEGYSTLNIAASMGHIDIVILLLSQGSNKETKSKNGNTPLITAASNGHPQIVNFILSCGADKEARNNHGNTALTMAAFNGHANIVSLLLSQGSYEEARNNSSDTALFRAAGNGHADVVNVLLSRGVNINAKNDMNATALLIALCNDHTEVVNLLLSYDCDTEVKTVKDFTALLLMASAGRTDFVKLLLRQGANKEAKSDEGNTSLHIAAYKGRLDTVESLLDDGSNIDAKGMGGSTALLFATHNGHIEVVQLLMSRGCDKDATNDDGNTALIFAVEKEDINIANLLLSRDCNKEISNKYGNTALLVAAFSGNIAIVNLLLAYGSNMEAKDAEGSTSLIAAACAGHTDIVNLLLTQGADRDGKDGEDTTALIQAAFVGQLDVLSLLLSQGCDANAKNNYGNTALNLAVRQGHAKVVNLLLSHGCEIDSRNKDNDTALISAAYCGQHAIVKLLLSHGSDLEAKTNEGETALIKAASAGNATGVYLLLNAGAHTEATDVHGKTALATAAEEGYGNVVSLLLSYDSDKEIKTNKGDTPLMLASSKGHTSVVNLLLSQGAEKDAKNLEGHTALILAADFGYTDVVKALLSEGCDRFFRNSKNNSALTVAAFKGHTDIVNLLLSDDTDVNITNNEGNTPLILATKGKFVPIINLLLTKGANTNVKNNTGDTALILAADGGDSKVVNLLLSAGADVNITNDAGGTALITAACNGHGFTVSLLLCQGCDKELKTKVGNTALMLAAGNGHLTTVNILLSQDVDKEARNNEGKTALMLAARDGHTGVVKSLLRDGADKDVTDYMGNTCLTLASLMGRTDTVNFLLRCGYDKEAKNDDGYTAVNIAAMSDKADVVHSLLSSGSNKEAEDNDGNTAFILASMYSNIDVLKHLLEFNVNKEAKNTAGNTALIMAVCAGNVEVVELLLAANCDKEAQDHDGNTPLVLSVIYRHNDVLNLLLSRGSKTEAQNYFGNTALIEAAVRGDVDAVQLLLAQDADKAVRNSDGKNALMYAVENEHFDVTNLLLQEGTENGSQ